MNHSSTFCDTSLSRQCGGAVILEDTAKIFDPPVASNVFAGDILAEFQMDARIESTVWHGDVLFDCRLSTGSSQGDYEWTVALLAANVLESAFERTEHERSN